MLLRKTIVSFFLMLGSLAFAKNELDLYRLRTEVVHEDKSYHLNISYEVPLTACQAFNFLTDYEGAKNIKGVLDSKVITRDGNKVIVERTIEEKIFFFDVKQRSVLEMTELPNLGIDYFQVKGDNKYYQGAWRIFSNGHTSRLEYKSVFEPNTIVPDFLVEYFIKNNINDRFLIMAQAAEKSISSPKIANAKCEK